MPNYFKFNKSEFKDMPAVPQGLYTVRFVDFKPKISAKGNSLNYNPVVEISEHEDPDLIGRKIFTPLNSSISKYIQDFVHSYGLLMEETGPDELAIPGVFDASPDFNEEDPSTWKYEGPLTGRTAQWEIGIHDYMGKVKNDVVRFECAVPNCAQLYLDISHSQDMRRKSA
jgi:hypothetical protein